MHVKKFEAKTMKEALEMVKVELGPEAIILNAKDNSKKHGLVGEGSVEITAAISELELRKKQLVESKYPEKKREIFAINNIVMTTKYRILVAIIIIERERE